MTIRNREAKALKLGILRKRLHKYIFENRKYIISLLASLLVVSFISVCLTGSYSKQLKTTIDEESYGYLEEIAIQMNKALITGITESNDIMASYARKIEQTGDWSLQKTFDDMLNETKIFNYRQIALIDSDGNWVTSSGTFTISEILEYVSRMKKLNAAVTTPGSEEKYKKVMDILTWISSVEGQRAIISPETPMISSVKGVSLGDNEFLEEVENTIAEGRIVPQPLWYGDVGSSVDATFRKGLYSWITGEKTAKQVMAECDQMRDNLLLDNIKMKMIKIGVSTQAFTVHETSLYLAELFKNEMNTDISLVLSNSRTCGNNGKIYEGDILVTEDIGSGAGYSYGYLLDNFKTSGVTNPTTQLLKVTMTGSQIISALNDPAEQSFYPNRYYVAAGLKIEFAPWAGENKRYINVKMNDGTDLDPLKTYTVAIWNSTIKEDYISEVVSVSDKTA